MCTTHTKSTGLAITITSLTFYLFAFILNVLNCIYLFFITKDKKRFTIYLTYYSLNAVIFKVAVVLYILDYFYDDWNMGNAACKYTFFSIELGKFMAAFILLCMCLDQYYFVFHSQTYLKHYQNPRLIVFILFCISFGLNIPFIFLYHVEFDKCNRQICIATKDVTWYKIVLACKTVIFFVIPSFWILFLYIKIIRYLRKRKQTLNKPRTNSLRKDECVNESSDQDDHDKNNVIAVDFENETNRKKLGQYERTIIYLALIFGWFFASALPFFVTRTMSGAIEIHPDTIKYTHMLWILGHAYHPVLYTLSNKNFREDIIKRLKKIFNK